MASNLGDRSALLPIGEMDQVEKANRFHRFVIVFLKYIGSLKLTITLLLMAIFIVLAGTMAQVEKDIWQVTGEYFRTAIAWIDIDIFFPRHWFPQLEPIPGRFPFPGGWLIGAVMAVNLLAAHAYLFRIQARSTRLAMGAVLSLLGILVTWLVIGSGSNMSPGNAGAQDWSTFRLALKWGLGLLWLAGVVALLVMDRSRKGVWSLTCIACLMAAGAFVWISFGGENAIWNDSSLRILWQLIKGAVASLILLAGCWLLFGRRAGVVLIHAGVALIMLGELLVGTQAVEGLMRIEEGQTANYVEIDRSHELAIVDSSDPQEDDVVVVPGSMLVAGRTISHEELPFDIHVLAYFPHSSNHPAHAAKANLANAGLGRFIVAKEEKPVSGTSNEMNLPSAYLKLTEKGSSTSLGTYLVGLAQSYRNIVDRIPVSGKFYDVSLRFKRMYKPYSIRLEDFRHDTYLGTDKARYFSSDIHLVDPSRGEDRKVRIWMNNPLRYGGETFYQSGYATNSETGAQITVLQIVSNQGWMIPYVACMMVGTGMLAHFWMMLIRFLNQRAEKTAKDPLEGVCRLEDRLTAIGSVLLPVIVIFSASGFLILVARPPATTDTEMDLHQFGKLPLVYEGRVKPFDTFARNSLSLLSKKQTFKDASGKTEPAIRWLLDVITESKDSMNHRIFRIEDPDVLHILGLEQRAGLRYALQEFSNRAEEFDRQAERAQKKKQHDRTVFQKKILELSGQLRFFRLIEESFRAVQLRQGHEEEDVPVALEQVEQLVRFQPPLAIPDEDPSSSMPWQPFALASVISKHQMLHGQEPNPAMTAFSAILAAYAAGDAPEFNREVRNYQAILKTSPPAGYHPAKIDFEVFFNQSQPFVWSAFLYVVAFILAALAWLGWSTPLNRSSFWLIGFTVTVHTVALIARMYISGRPPVTNLYSSAVFIGWASVVLGIIIERIHGMGVGNVLASVAGFLSLLVAYFLSRSGDTFAVLEAVLDTQFWLATHVVCITLGYSTTFIAGLLGILYVLRGVFTPSLSQHVGEEMSRMIYGTVCFSIFFSFLGTVLGGLWADDSWGRFWGWDPKENGALIIVLWNALVLHARWDGLVHDRGLAILAIGGNICTAWSWFGTNELGVGKHSYGFTEGVLFAFGIFCASQLAVILIGLLPRRLWWSMRNDSARQMEY